MITISATPSETFFAGNPVLFAINSDNLYAYIGRKCQFYLVVSAADTTAGHTLEFAFQDKTVIFETAAIADDSGLQIPTALLSANWDTWAQTLYDCLISNFDISSRFNIQIEPAGASNRVLFFQAVKEGAASSAIVTSHLSTATVFTFISGLDSITRNNFSIVGGIWDKNLQQIARDIKPVSADGNVTFNFSEYLSVLLENNTQPRFTWPFDASRLFSLFSNYVLAFTAGFAERYEGTIRKITFDRSRQAIPGGLNRETMVAYNSAGLDFFTQPDNLKSFLTWAPVSKLTSKTSPELLFFYVGAKPSFTALELIVSVTFTDASTENIQANITEIPANSVIELSVGFRHLNLEGRFPTKTASQWAVKLVNQDLHLDTEIRTFVLDSQFAVNERIFIFQNSYAKAYDVIRFTGKGSTDIDVDFSTSNSDTIGNYTSFNAPTSKFAASEVQKMKCNSGWISRQTKDYMRELLLSKQVFEYKDNALFPVIITNDKVKSMFDDDEFLYNIELSYDRAYRDFFFQSS